MTNAGNFKCVYQRVRYRPGLCMANTRVSAVTMCRGTPFTRCLPHASDLDKAAAQQANTWTGTLVRKER